MIATRHYLAALLVIAASCARSTASSTPPGELGAAARAEQISKDPNIISQQELLDPAIMSLDLASAIRRLRPSFFRSSGPQSFSNASAGSVQVSHDFGPLLPVSQLNSLNAMSIVEIRYLDTNAAQNRFGINANGGPVIVLLSNKQVP
ncbi:MAG TPA: hypothetical protein VGP25_05220 [Gemmatimonadaceae bacterium]|jgi:hypothetical protein|nr:hypothetical protein [Gemmatimonadaceae bacterium]